jgi:hypothetical protein
MGVCLQAIHELTRLKDTIAPIGAFSQPIASRQGNRFRGFLNGQQVVEATDDSFRSGGVGLWTKADSVTCFDDVFADAR